VDGEGVGALDGISDGLKDVLGPGEGEVEAAARAALLDKWLIEEAIFFVNRRSDWVVASRNFLGSCSRPAISKPMAPNFHAPTKMQRASSPAPSISGALGPVDRALAALRALDHEQRLSLGGTLAVLLGRRAAWWDLETGSGERFCAALLRAVMCDLLQLPTEQFSALEPLAQPHPPGAEAISPEPFVESLPASQARREELVHGLVVLMAVGVALASTGGKRSGGSGALGAGYDSRSRQLLADLSATLGVPWGAMARREAQLAAALASELRAQRSAARSQRDEERKANEAESEKGRAAAWLGKRWKRGLAVAGVGIASGAAVALTAGLAAPAVIGGLLAVGGGVSTLGAAGAVVGTAVGSLTALLSGAAGVVVITSVFGATGAGLAAYKMDRRLADVSEFHFLQPSAKMLTRAQRGCVEEVPSASRVTQRVLLSSAVARVPQNEAPRMRERLAAALRLPLETVALAIDATASPLAVEVSIAVADAAAAISACELMRRLTPAAAATALDLPVLSVEAPVRDDTSEVVEEEEEAAAAGSPRAPALSVFIGISGWLEPGADVPTRHWWVGGAKNHPVLAEASSAAASSPPQPVPPQKPLSWEEGIARAAAEAGGEGERGAGAAEAEALASDSAGAASDAVAWLASMGARPTC